MLCAGGIVSDKAAFLCKEAPHLSGQTPIRAGLNVGYQETGRPLRRLYRQWQYPLLTSLRNLIYAQKFIPRSAERVVRTSMSEMNITVLWSLRAYRHYPVYRVSSCARAAAESPAIWRLRS